MDIPSKFIAKTAEETSEIGQKLAAHLKTLNTKVGDKTRQLSVICLYGDLGSGKTTFVQGFAKGLGIYIRLLSPTYIIVRRYDINSASNYFYHLDLYRLKSAPDLDGLGLSEIFADRSNFVAVEWAEKLGELRPKLRIDVFFTPLGENKRRIVIKQS